MGRYRQQISNLEYKRKYFMDVLCESFAEIHHRCIESAPVDEKYETCKAGARHFFKEQMGIENMSIETFKRAVSPTATYFANTIIEAAEEMAEDKAKEVVLNKDLPIDPDPKMSEEDKAVMDVIFTSKCPEDEITAIKSATANALYAENKKAEEIKEALTIVSADADNKTLQESINKISNIGPTSLMNAIMANVTENMLKAAINENASLTPGELVKMHANDIKEDSMVMYALFECINGFGFKTYDSKQVERLAMDIYLDK